MAGTLRRVVSITDTWFDSRGDFISSLATELGLVQGLSSLGGVATPVRMAVFRRYALALVDLPVSIQNDVRSSGGFL